MIEMYGGPAFTRVTTAAVRAVVTVVVIVFDMATVTCHVHLIGKRILAVTIIAPQFGVPPEQFEFGITGVVETRVGPRDRAVTSLTLAAAAAIVGIIFSVTVNTLTGSIPAFDFRLVTILTSDVEMIADKLEIRQNVIESIFVKPQDVGVAALMLRMAGCALIIAGSIGSAVKAKLVADVAGDVLVAIKAKRSLRRPAECLVAGRTLRLQVSMTGHNVSGHNQRLDGLGGSSVTQ